MNGMRLWIGVVLLAFCCGISQAGSIVYVDDDAPAGGNGSSWEKAYRYLQDGLLSSSAGDEVRVAQGVYKPDRSAAKPEGSRDRAASFELKDGMILKGGYAGLAGVDPNTWDNAVYRTILSGDLAGNDLEVRDPMNMFVDKTNYSTSTFIIECKEPTLSENSHHVVTVKGEGTLKGCEVTAGQGADPTIAIPLYTWSPVIVKEFCGAGLYTEGGHVVVEDCLFRGNYSPYYGGGICIRPGDARIVRCRFERNLAKYWYGGGVYVDSGHVDLVKCDFENNLSSVGGGAGIEDSKAAVTGCTFVENIVTGSGGGMILWNHTQVGRVIDCVFVGNQGGWAGGGSFSSKGLLELEGCRFVGNRAVHDGGGIRESGLKMSHCVMVGNRAGEAGGAIETSGGGGVISNCTVFGNWAPRASFLTNGSSSGTPPLCITNSIIWDGGNEIRSGESIIEIRYTDLKGGREAVVVNVRGVLVWGPGNVDVDPCFADPGYWDPNGTPNDSNDDFWVEGDYHLKSQAGRWDPVIASWVKDDVTSPCIDAGDPNTPVGYESLPNGGRINMGVYGGTAQASLSGN